MPTNSKEYNKKVYKKYWGSKQWIKDRSQRNSARAKAMKEWKVKKWDWKEIDHKKWLKAGNGKKNLRVISRKTNRVLWAAKANKSKWRIDWPNLFYV